MFRLRILTAAMAISCGLAAPAVQFREKPATVRIAVPAAAKKSRILLLQLRGVVIPAEAQASWHVFCDNPEADGRTSVDDPSFCGSVNVLAYGAGVRKPANFTLQLPERPAAKIRAASEVRLTFVPMTAAPISVSSIALE